jgi:O-antigen/teichoic acid export membrane protein
MRHGGPKVVAHGDGANDIMEAYGNVSIRQRGAANLQLRVWHIARSAFSNWFSTAASLAVGLFLSPFIVHRLGDVAYGVWVLAISSINYLSLLDLGMASSVLRFVSKGHASGDHTGASDALSAVLWVRLQIGAVILLCGGGLAFAFPHVFKVPPMMAGDARLAILIISVTTTISMSFGVFSSTLSALNRYDLRSYISLVQLAIRVIGVVAVLRTGHGIVAIALCELAAAAVGNGLLVAVARRIYPELKINLNKPRSEVLRNIWSYSAYAFLVTIAVQLVYQTDNLVVGAFITAGAVTFYSIGNSLCRYTSLLVSSMTATFTPTASTYEASDNTAGLRALYFNGTRSMMAISLPVVVTLILRGGTFIGVWMGPQYARPSGVVLMILALAQVFSILNMPAGAIAFGVGKHQTVARWAIGEGIANLVLSVVLARRYGISGVAIGTLIPSLFANIYFWPRYIPTLVDITYTQVFTKVWVPLLLSAVPFALASYAVDRFVPVHSMPIFLLQTFGLLPVFAITLGLIFRDNVKRQVLPRVRSYFFADAK